MLQGSYLVYNLYRIALVYQTIGCPSTTGMFYSLTWDKGMQIKKTANNFTFQFFVAPQNDILYSDLIKHFELKYFF